MAFPKKMYTYGWSVIVIDKFCTEQEIICVIAKPMELYKLWITF